MSREEEKQKKLTNLKKLREEAEKTLTEEKEDREVIGKFGSLLQKLALRNNLKIEYATNMLSKLDSDIQTEESS